MTTTKDRLISATSELFRLRGYAGTGVKQIVEAAGVPFGSMYHFFPAGKEELGAETIRWSGAMYGLLIEYFFSGDGDPVEATRQFFAGAAEHVHETDYVDACPIATVALEVASTNETLRLATAEVFESWLAALDGHFTRLGLTRAEARNVSVSLFCLLEGSFILARATRDHAHIVTAGQVAADTVRAALEAATRTSRRRGGHLPLTSPE